MVKRDVIRMAHADPQAVREQSDPHADMKLPDIPSPTQVNLRSPATATLTALPSSEKNPSLTEKSVSSKTQPKKSNAEIVVRTNKGWQTLAPERTTVLKDLIHMRAVSDTESAPKLAETESTKHHNWSKRQKIAWLLCYETEYEIRTTKEDDSRWVRFAKRMYEEFDVKKDNIQCQKQVNDANNHILNTCQFLK